MALNPLCIINVVGLTPGHIGKDTPRLFAMAQSGSCRPLEGVVPAVTCSAQATMLTGVMPARHGIVGNGWYSRETGEVRFWLQSNRLIEAETLYATARRLAASRNERFTCAKLFWWFNQGAAVDWSVTPKPHYGADGSKVFAISSSPLDLAAALEQKLGSFPFHTFWGPLAGLACTDWIAQAAADLMRRHRPTLTLVYLPHLDYDLQRFGPDSEVVSARLREVDGCAGAVLDAAGQVGARAVVVSEYGLTAVDRPVLVNRVLRSAGRLSVRPGPFGEMLDTFASQAFAVCDHQVAHVYVSEATILPAVAELLRQTPGVARVLDKQDQRDFELEHIRSGDLVALAEPNAWFAYPYWLDDARAPDFARTVDIHRKPGYDPCELFTDPSIPFPKLRVAIRLIQKRLGFRYLMDVIPLDASLVRGSHGLPAPDVQHGPVLVAECGLPEPLPGKMTELKEWLLLAMGYC